MSAVTVLKITGVRPATVKFPDGTTTRVVRIDLADGKKKFHKSARLTTTTRKPAEVDFEAMQLVLRVLRDAVVEHSLRTLIDKQHAQLERARRLLLTTQ